MTLPYERKRSVKRLIAYRREVCGMTLTEFRKNAREIMDELHRIGRHLCTEDGFDDYYEERE